MKLLLIAVVSIWGSVALASSDLKDCEKKIAEMIKQVKTTDVRVLSETRVDKYHLGKDEMCGVELLDKILTITMFKEPKTADKVSVEPAKFETIILNGNDPTFTDGRVKANVTCEIGENSVQYITKVPVLTDGVKTPWAIEKLVIKQEQNEISVSLRASQTPIHKVFRSITKCTLVL